MVTDSAANLSFAAIRSPSRLLVKAELSMIDLVRDNCPSQPRPRESQSIPFKPRLVFAAAAFAADTTAGFKADH